jgi:hypothetical protein
MKTTTFVLFLTIILMAGCDLFNSQTNSDFMANLDAEIAWANAPQLELTLAIPPGWGTSPQIAGFRDAVRTNERPRMGYSFNAEFTPNSGFRFVTWLAFKSGEYTLAEIAAMDFDEALEKSLRNTDEVLITPPVLTPAGAFSSTITININIPIILVPFCDERLHVRHSNPPLVNNGFFYTRNQEIRIWFSAGLDKETVAFDDNLIMIRGHNISNGMPWSEDGDLRQFYDIKYNPGDDFIIIEPHGDPAPPGNLNVTVSLGMGILSENQYEEDEDIEIDSRRMANTTIFSFRISNEEVTRAYKANNVWAVHDPATARVGSFFFQIAPEERDRRLRKNSRGNYEVTLYFSVSRSMGEIENPEPNMITIAEIFFADLTGTEPKIPKEVIKREFTILGPEEYGGELFVADPMENTPNSAGSIYRQMNPATNPLGVEYYRVVYEFDRTDIEPGIYRLAVLPWRESNPDELDVWQTAVAEDRFVSIVINNVPPGPVDSGMLTLSGHRSINPRHNFNPENNRWLGMSGNFNDIHDNGGRGNGILLNDARPNLPWTMDEQLNLEWQWRIGSFEENTDPNIRIQSPGWILWANNPPVQDLRERIPVNEPEDDIRWQIQIRFRDTLGNTSDWTEMADFLYVPFVPSEKAENVNVWYEDAGIEVRWRKPSSMDEVRITLLEVSRSDQGGVTGTTPRGEIHTSRLAQGSHRFPVPSINASGISDGMPSVVTEYLVEIRTFSDDLPYQELVSIRIWNIPNLTVTEDNPLIEINQGNWQAQFGYIRNSGLGLVNSVKRYILTSDIVIPPTLIWEPIGGNGKDAFHGRFFGNGKTITFNSSFQPNLTDYGIFGEASGAEIRDLAVVYQLSNTVNQAVASQTRFGGIAGRLNNTVVTNSIVRGVNENIYFRFNAGSAFTQHIRFGGIAGETNSSIINCLGGIELRAYRDGAGETTAGGLVGFAAGGSSSIANSYTTRPVIVTNTGAGGTQMIGGLVGESQGAVSGSTAAGSITVSSSGVLRVGGISGWGNGGSIEDCVFTGNISNDNSAAGNRYIGGIAGQGNNLDISGSSVGSASSRNSITIGATQSNAAFLEVGGIIGLLQDSGSVSDSHAHANIFIGAGDAARSPARLKIGGLVGISIPGGSNRITIADSTHTGNITIWSSSATENYIGGVVGEAPRTTFNDTRSYGRNITVNKTGAGGLWVGGFVGQVLNNTDVRFDGSSRYAPGDFSTGTLIINATNGNSQLFVGGFAGEVGTGNPLTGIRSFATVTVNTQAGTSGNNFHAAGIAGVIRSTMDDCIARGNITVTVPNTTRVGGLAGSAFAAITNSSASGNVHVTSSGTAGNHMIGGLVGHASAAAATVSNSSSATGNVTLVNTGTQVSDVGGLVGNSAATISSGTASGIVTATGGGELRVGGLVGNITAAITNGRAESNVTATSTGSGLTRVGGLVGQTTQTISGSHTTGNITATANSTNHATVGGLVGQTGSTDASAIDNSSASGTVTVTRNVASGSGDIAVGGLVGHLAGNGGTIRRSHAASAARVRLTVSGAGTGVIYVGGLIASTEGHVRDSRAENNVELIQNSVTMEGRTSNVGGLVGATRNQPNREITGSHATGNVVVSGGSGDFSSGDLNVGGLIGFCNSGSFTNSYFNGNINLNNHSIGIQRVGGIIGSGRSLTITNCTVGLVSHRSNIRIGEIQSFYSNLNVGGIIGQIVDDYLDGNVESTVSGSNANVNINVGASETIRISGEIYLGGLLGRIDGRSWFTHKFNNSSHTGDITVWSGSYDFWSSGLNCIGGIAGFAGFAINTEFKDTVSGSGTIRVNKIANTGSLNVGGFIGFINDYANLNFTGTSVSAPGNPIINTTSSGSNLHTFVGGFVGSIAHNNDPISGINSSVNITATVPPGQGSRINAGGLVGMGSITNSSTTGTVNVTGFGDLNAGGITGNGSVTNSSSSVIVTAASTGSNDYWFNPGISAGGLAGMGNITNSSATGNVTATSTGTGTTIISAGGLTGGGSVTNSFATGNVTATGTAFMNVGGLAGGGSVSSSFYMGNVAVTRNDAGNPNDGTVSVGGLIGNAGGGVDRSWAGGTVNYTMNTNVYIWTMISQVGGLAGSTRAIYNSYALNDVTVHNGFNGGIILVGGLAGNVGESGVGNNFALGIIDVKNVLSGLNVGGITGRFSAGNSFSPFFQSNVALGDIIAPSATWGVIDRIFGHLDGNGLQNVDYNRARHPMKVTETDYFPSSTSARMNGRGADVDVATLKTQGFWTGMGFQQYTWDSIPLWNFSNVESMGFPFLAGTGEFATQQQAARLGKGL